MEPARGWDAGESEYPGGAKRRDSTTRHDVVKLYFYTERETNKNRSDRARLLDNLGDTPGLGLGDRSAFLDLYQIAGCRLHSLDMRVVLF